MHRFGKNLLILCKNPPFQVSSFQHSFFELLTIYCSTNTFSANWKNRAVHIISTATIKTIV